VMLAKTWSDFGGAHLQGGDRAVARQGARAALRASPAHLPGWKLLVKTFLPAGVAHRQQD
jgi:hypothetical protein